MSTDTGLDWASLYEQPASAARPAKRSRGQAFPGGDVDADADVYERLGEVFSKDDTDRLLHMARDMADGGLARDDLHEQAGDSQSRDSSSDSSSSSSSSDSSSSRGSERSALEKDEPAPPPPKKMARTDTGANIIERFFPSVQAAQKEAAKIPMMLSLNSAKDADDPQPVPLRRKFASAMQTSYKPVVYAAVPLPNKKPIAADTEENSAASSSSSGGGSGDDDDGSDSESSSSSSSSSSTSGSSPSDEKSRDSSKASGKKRKRHGDDAASSGSRRSRGDKKRRRHSHSLTLPNSLVKDECFMCAWGDLFHDGIEAPHVNRLNSIFYKNYGLVENAAIAQMMHIYYMYYIYDPTRGMPILSQETVLEHIEAGHILDPRVIVGEQLRAYMRIFQVIQDYVFYDNNQFNHKAITALSACTRQILSLQSRDLTKLNFYNPQVDIDTKRMGSVLNVVTTFTQRPPAKSTRRARGKAKVTEAPKNYL